MLVVSVGEDLTNLQEAQVVDYWQLEPLVEGQVDLLERWLEDHEEEVLPAKEASVAVFLETPS